MRGGLISSVVLHAAILGWALVNIQTLPPLTVPEPEPLDVDLVTAADVTKLRQGVRTAKQQEAEAKPTPQPEVAKKEAPKPTPVAAAPPPPEPPPAAPPEPELKPEPKPEPPKPEPKPEQEPEKVAALPEPPPVPSPDEQKRLEELVKEQERQAEEQRLKQRQEEEKKKREEEKKKREEEKKKREAELKKKRELEAKKKEFDASKIAALLNKTPDKAPSPAAADPDSTSKNHGPVRGAPEGHDRQISASELAVLRQIITTCVKSKWNVLAGGQDAQGTIVKLRMRFNLDGTLAGAPVVQNPQGSAYFLAISDSAVRAVQACEPFPLPPNTYEFWKDIVMNFDPRDMF